MSKGTPPYRSPKQEKEEDSLDAGFALLMLIGLIVILVQLIVYAGWEWVLGGVAFVYCLYHIFGFHRK